MPDTILEDRRKLVVRLATAAEILGVVVGYILALTLCLPPHAVLRGESGLFVSQGVLLVNLLELLILIGARLSLRRDRGQGDHAQRPGTHGELWAARRETLVSDTALTVLFWLVFRAQSRPVLFIALFLVLAPLLRLVFRFLLSLLLRAGLLRRSTIHLLIVGANERGAELYRESLDYPFLSIFVVGVVDDADHTGGAVPLIGGLKDLVTILRDRIVDVVVICLPIRSHYDAILTAMQDGTNQGIPCECPGSFFPPNACKMGEDAEGRSIITSCPAANSYDLAKRVFDVAAALVLLAVFSPVMLLAAIRIKLEDGGPLIYVQPRVGLNKRIFSLYKFRSMMVDAEKRQPALEGANEMDGPVFKIADDPRVTRVGHWLRKYNIDEMPQLMNVLRGEMSVVGPRPMSLRDYDRLTEDWTRRRFTVKPGLTCYWQTMPHRNAMRFSEWMTLDMRYIEQCSLWEDVAICLRTIPALLRGSGV
jgi:exopolysaccharide biosynthesis polyprenyl glycosylphosphotransferase